VLLVEQRNAVRILIEKGADPNMRDSEGRNALMLMSMESRRDKDIELTIEDRATIEPGLLYRQRDRAVELIGETLLNAGCDINAADNKGRTPLMYAAIFERPGVVNLLLKRGANINVKDHDGLSALDWAKKSGNIEILRPLYSSLGNKETTLPRLSEIFKEHSLYSSSGGKKTSR
jgi:uncharacterized protein